jgi:hypothetical protein
MINPYRDAAMDALFELVPILAPMVIGNCGGRPIWAWWGRSYAAVVNLREKYPTAYLPDFVFEKLTGYALATELTREYDSKEAAEEALVRVLKSL